MPESEDAAMINEWATGVYKFNRPISVEAHELHVKYLLTDMDKLCNTTALPGLKGRECQWPTADMFQKASGYLHDLFCRNADGQERRHPPTHTRALASDTRLALPRLAVA